MSFNLFDWIREGVKRSVIQGVQEALQAIGSPTGDDGAARLADFIPVSVSAGPKLPNSTTRKRLGRSLHDTGSMP